jgi:3'-phosphoadenosine 5'-phosphosulfate sulfotransferase (PAPS reductase)/FAD synthetase
MRQNHPEIDMHYYFTDTGKELPEVIDFVNRLEGYVGEIIDPYEEIHSSNRIKKDFDYYLKEHKNYLPSPKSRWCTIQMKLVPYEQWVNMKMTDEGYEEVVSYVGIRSDEPERTGFMTNTVNSNYMKIKMPFREDGIDRNGVFDILKKADLFSDHPDVIAYRQISEESDEVICELFESMVRKKKQDPSYKGNVDSTTLRKIVEAMDAGKPGYYGWRSRSGCTFCFYQQKIEWLRLMDIYPDAFEEAKSYEKAAEEERADGTFYWLGKDTPLSSLENQQRKQQILENHQKKYERYLKKKNKRRNALQIEVKEIDTDVMDDLYDEQEGGGACVTCYK